MMKDEAYPHCRFGQWYYNVISVDPHIHLSNITIETEHRLMHSSANNLLMSSTERETNDKKYYYNKI